MSASHYRANWDWTLWVTIPPLVLGLLFQCALWLKDYWSSPAVVFGVGWYVGIACAMFMIVRAGLGNRIMSALFWPTYPLWFWIRL